MATVKQVAKSKTINGSGLVAVLGFLQANSEQIQALVPEYAYGWIMLVIGAYFTWVRTVTDRPLSQK